ncbi:VOC family protein [Phocoenobacter skyensis]|uniref:Uncharacterized conserved protein PhnB, glyoxalase superfamily n=1 Tax=Phocoenobacter skyensis TaxID=97481 RepID=A0A1H7X5I8_9PAST|nr:VOC family protein [Pasteurella skyensis]MDP8079586.1 VOC family protein [Pasteurella skyensis]MDP8085535.1 VOC family protein [Pasteurella skyensis]MDP8186112.1 VOC family protein [Pasteurella skyensis]QLB21907.1 glyoxalase [Pasteurella skyensis]SEM28398.1 Uncharacterized conserved protein PhnB, glyoxalase superfamily [Pasteurella skyensis]
MKINKLSPNLAVKDINETVHFYTEHFGFTLVMAVPESQDGVEQTLDKNKAYVYAMLQKDNIELMLQRLDSFQQDMTFCKTSTTGATVSFYMEIDGISKLHQSLKNKNLTITDLKTTWYGMKEFYVQDLNGYILGFAEKVE